jgi:hypothetical protein
MTRAEKCTPLDSVIPPLVAAAAAANAHDLPGGG